MDQNRIKRNQMLGAKDCKKNLQPATWKLIIQTPKEEGSEEKHWN